MNSGLEIPREYYYIMEEQDENTNCWRWQKAGPYI
jgi:hypothetical protein